jgi:hypothetical protein
MESPFVALSHHFSRRRRLRTAAALLRACSRRCSDDLRRSPPPRLREAPFLATGIPVGDRFMHGQLHPTCPIYVNLDQRMMSRLPDDCANCPRYRTRVDTGHARAASPCVMNGSSPARFALYRLWSHLISRFPARRLSFDAWRSSSDRRENELLCGATAGGFSHCQLAEGSRTRTDRDRAQKWRQISRRLLSCAQAPTAGARQRPVQNRHCG